jgi:hypothetical protein
LKSASRSSIWFRPVATSPISSARGQLSGAGTRHRLADGGDGAIHEAAQRLVQHEREDKDRQRHQPERHEPAARPQLRRRGQRERHDDRCVTTGSGRGPQREARQHAVVAPALLAGDDRFPGQRDGLIGIRGRGAGNNGGRAVLQPHERDRANRRHPVRELAQAVLDFRGDPGPSPELQVVDDGFGGDKACLAKVALGGLLEQADLEHRLDAQDEGDDHRNGQDEAPAERQCAHL